MCLELYIDKYCAFCFDTLQASELKRLAVYLDVHTVLWTPSRRWEDMKRADWDQLFRGSIASDDGTEGPGAKADPHTYVLKPVDGNLNYIRRGRNVRCGESQAIQEAALELQAISFHVSRECWSSSQSSETELY